MVDNIVIESLDLSDQPKLDSETTKGRFHGKVVVITGGAGGIGSATAARFLSDGASVALVDLNTPAAERLLRTDEFQRGCCRHYATDISLRKNAFEVVDRIAADFGKINFLVNSVAYFRSSGLTSDDDQWSDSMRVNVASYAFMGQACYAHMKLLTAKGEQCAIVNTSSISAHQVQPNRWSYAAAKGAVNILTKSMALDMAPGNVRVNSISPSWIWSPEVAKAKRGVSRSEWEREIVGPFHISRRMGEMAEVAAVMAFLCSKDASYINASDVKVDGGYGAMSAEGHGGKSTFAGTQ